MDNDDFFPYPDQFTKELQEVLLDNKCRRNHIVDLIIMDLDEMNYDNIPERITQLRIQDRRAYLSVKIVKKKHGREM